MKYMAPFEPMEANLRAALGVFAGAHPSGETRECGGVAVAASRVNFSMFNAATLTAPVESAAELEQRVELAAAYFSSQGLPWSFWLCQSWLAPALRSHAAQAFSRRGLHLVIELPGMAAERVLPPARKLPAPRYCRVSDAATRADFNHIMASTFGIPFPISREIYESEGTWGSGFTGWVAYESDLPVASTATLVAAGVVGVYAVGTLPYHQRRGYGEAVMRHALEWARAESGLERTVLESSEAGFRLYERMGYRTTTRYAVFAYS